jgi:hypothetical protein
MATTLCKKIFICFHRCHYAAKTRNQSLKKINKGVRTAGGVVTAKSTGETGLHERAQRFLVSHA